MKLSFQREQTPRVAPTAAEFPALSGAEIAGMVYGQRVGGDFYHFLRANPWRVIFGLLDIAGSHQENQRIVEAARRDLSAVGQPTL